MNEMYPYKYICSDKTQNILMEFNNRKYKKLVWLHFNNNLLIHQIQ